MTNEMALELNSKSELTYVKADGQSPSLSYCQAPIRGLITTTIFFCLTVVSFFFFFVCGALSLTRGRVCRDSRVGVRVRVTLRLAVCCQSVRLGAESLENHGQIFFFQLNSCGISPYTTTSLMRGWVYRLQLLLVLASGFILGPISYTLSFETSFLSPPTTRRATVEVFDSPSTRE
jgi:hypothetical protein